MGVQNCGLEQYISGHFISAVKLKMYLVYKPYSF